ncbi:toll/interleukin-1 receptor domain-containing protein [Rhabdochromatium marinum]|uniref:toll/interleukin-1 receptor domain-containing protein n=1 Tax=Rhabdochromatium marinum TaxID=48729 RepID=UPI0019045931|nr:toll/interleukin-1 receptor domain-containing protein [Rhabdochromatium marinum]MBK1649253.1 hypothetical protein [Rhabdochromatium marinum]
MKKQGKLLGAEIVTVLLGLMMVFYLALVLLGGADYLAALKLVLYTLAGLVALMLLGYSITILRTDDLRRIFILYDGQDAPFVSKLYDALKIAPIRVLWDKQEVQVGDNIEEKFKQLFNSSSDIIFVVSKHSVAAQRMDEAIANAVQKNKRIFPVLLDNVEVPEALKIIKAADFRLSFDDGYLSLREALRTRREPSPS